MAGTSDIISLGFGSWSSVAKVPTLGFTVGAVVVPTVPGLEYTLRKNRLHFTVQESRLHFTAKKNRLHYTVSES